MERVAFLVEPDDLRISCMLNPETVVIRRHAGIRERSSVGGAVSGGDLRDMPLLYTGGGVTTIEMELLFDITIRGSSLISGDVRDYTAPFFAMAENIPDSSGNKRPKTIRMVWGKNWNIPGVITDIAERLDYFTQSGIPRRSWLTLRMRRVNETDSLIEFLETLVELLAASADLIDRLDTSSPFGQDDAALALQNTATTVMQNDRLDAIATRFYNDPSLWRILAAFNGITDIAGQAADRLIQIPAMDDLRKLTGR